jgi:hypothetical protein
MVPRGATAGIVLLAVGLSTSACTPQTNPSVAPTSSSATIGSATSGDAAAATDREKALDRIAKAIAADSEAALDNNPGVYDLIGARRVEDWGVEFVYRFSERVDAEIQAATRSSNTTLLDTYMESVFVPIATRLEVPETTLLYSYFQPDGSHIVTISCADVPESGWRSYASTCSESYAIAEAYATGELLAP